MNRIFRRFALSGVALLLVIVIGTLGYSLIGGGQESLLNCLYMTVITITTIGYREAVNVEGNTAGLVFTMLLAFSGIGIMAYTISLVTALVVEGELLQTYRRRRMERQIEKSSDHYLVCGAGETGIHIAVELVQTQRSVVLLDKRSQDELDERLRDLPFVEGDATDEKALKKAGIERACGVFAATNDNNCNLVIIVTSKLLNPRARVVARASDPHFAERMKKVGADAVVSPAFIGGMRLASEMIRPTAVSFLDTMLRDKKGNLRIEELPIPGSCIGKSVSFLRLRECGDLLLLALRNADAWVFNPPEDAVLTEGVKLILMATPEARRLLEERLSREEKRAGAGK